MGYFKHEYLIVSGCDSRGEVKKVYTKAVEIFGDLTTSMSVGATNGYQSFMIGTDGSKEGWDTSNEYDKKREEFVAFLKESKTWVDLISVIDDEEDGVSATMGRD